VEQISRIGMDTSKRVFQVHGVDAAERPLLRRKLSRDAMLALFKGLAPTVVAIEACGSAHHWARTLGALGHEVKLVTPQLAKPYVKRGKNDAADAAALCEAMSRPVMRFVPVKTAKQQAALMLASERERLVRERTRLANTVRGHAAEFGLVVATGQAHLGRLLAAVAADEGVPALARDLFAGMAGEWAQLEARLAAADARLQAWHRESELSQRLVKVPGIGPVTACLLAMKTPDPRAFKSGRDFAAWLGLTPKDHSTAGKVRTGGITRAGDEGLRSLLVVGATSVIRHMRTAAPPKPGQAGVGGPAQAGQTGEGHARKGPAKPGGPRPWLAGLLERKPPKLAAIALANKPDARASSGTARVAWKLMASGEAYNPARPRPAAAAAAALAAA